MFRFIININNVKYVITLLLLSVCTLVSVSQSQGQTGSLLSEKIDRPKLIIGIAVDQMRWDYFYRYYDRYEEGGFKRLLSEGFSCENTFINYLPSYTGVGHASIFTGSVPAINGITANNWIDQISGEKTYCTEDTNEETVGITGDAGKMSPRNLLTTTITDELKLATNFRSKVVGVSLKDRAAILPAGHLGDAAFWFDDKSGKFISSTYYMKELPQWAEDFNSRKYPEDLVSKDWNTLYPIKTYVNSTEDNVTWESSFRGETTPTFPHPINEIYKKDRSSFRSTPFGNILTLDFAKEALKGYGLGKGEYTDFLTINLASTDFVGHQFGINSIEEEDTYLRLDKELSKFFKFLDDEIGEGNYLAFVSADHGGAHAAGFLQNHSIPAGVFKDLAPGDTVINNLKSYIDNEFKASDIIRSFSNYQINYNEEVIEKAGLDFKLVKEKTISFLQKQPGIQFVVDINNMGNTTIPEIIKTKITNGYNPKRSSSLIIIPEPGWYETLEKGSNHGNWNPYDTHIPLIFMGWGIKHGHSNKEFYITDIAPTLAAMLHIQMPNGSIGKPILSILNNE